jgi:hypothetical protein
MNNRNSNNTNPNEFLNIQLAEVREMENQAYKKFTLNNDKKNFFETTQAFDQELQLFKQKFYAAIKTADISNLPNIADVFIKLETIIDVTNTLAVEIEANIDLSCLETCKKHLTSLLNSENKLSIDCYNQFIVPLVDNFWKFKYHHVEKNIYPCAKYFAAVKPSTTKSIKNSTHINPRELAQANLAEKKYLQNQLKYYAQEISNFENYRYREFLKARKKNPITLKVQLLTNALSVPTVTKEDQRVCLLHDFINANTNANLFTYENFIFSLKADDNLLFDNDYLSSDSPRSYIFRNWKVRSIKLYNTMHNLLPEEIWCKIFLLLGDKELKKTASVCQFFNSIIHTYIDHKFYINASTRKILLPRSVVLPSDDLAYGQDGKLIILNACTGKEKHSIELDKDKSKKLKIQSLVVLANGDLAGAINYRKYVYVNPPINNCLVTGEIRIWDKKTFVCKKVIKQNDFGEVSSLAVFKNSDLFSYHTDRRDLRRYEDKHFQPYSIPSGIRIWDTRTGECKRFINLGYDSLKYGKCILLPNDDWAVTSWLNSSNYHQIKIMDIQTSKCKYTIRTINNVVDLAVTSNFLISISNSNSDRIYGFGCGEKAPFCTTYFDIYDVTTFEHKQNIKVAGKLGIGSITEAPNTFFAIQKSTFLLVWESQKFKDNKEGATLVNYKLPPKKL